MRGFSDHNMGHNKQKRGQNDIPAEQGQQETGQESSDGEY